ncbi:MAG: HAMP domain-containing protein [Anaerolineales bacterium]|nr:HAMP domain-containing protein [Anaerolineales bacterium]
MQSSIREIRNRLLRLLVWAFVIVLFLSFFFFIAVTGYFLASSQNPMDTQVATSLEGYYLGRGSWEGIETVFETNNEWNSLNLILLDNDQRILLDRRTVSGLSPEGSEGSKVGSIYAIQSGDSVVNLNIRGEQVGYLVVAPYSFAQKLRLVRAILFPIGIISFFLAIFLVVVATLLMRRFVNPLADVIYAAQEVASGDLKTRIPMKGPQDLRSLSESFNEMASSLERNDRERRDMLADIAHELRTPLSVIRGRLEGIVDGIYSENGSQVSMALEQAYLLERLVDDLRLLTLAETRQLPFDMRSLSVDVVIERVLEIFSAEAQEKNISLSFPEKDGNLSAFVDPQRFEQVMSNLIGNSLRYVPEGGRVWVTANQVSDEVRIAINDNGIGIPAEDLPYIFDRFWRKDKSRARLTGGTGLGLAIARQLVEAQGGNISAKTLQGSGLQISITFPLVNQDTPKHSASV